VLFTMFPTIQCYKPIQFYSINIFVGQYIYLLTLKDFGEIIKFVANCIIASKSVGTTA